MVDFTGIMSMSYRASIIVGQVRYYRPFFFEVLLASEVILYVQVYLALQYVATLVLGPTSS